MLECLHAAESSGGCGCSPACSSCGLREAVSAAFRGQPVTRKWAAMELNRKGKPAKVDLRVNCQPFNYGKSSFVLLVLEGLN